MGSWHIAMHHPVDGPSVVWTDGAPAAWTSPLLPGVGRAHLPHTESALRSGQTTKATVTTDEGEFTVIVHPAECPNGPIAYGASIWIGRDREPDPDGAPAIAGLCWDHIDGKAMISPALSAMTGLRAIDSADCPPAQEPQDLTRKLLAAPTIENAFLTACMTPTPGTISGFMSVLHDRGHIMNWRIDAVVDPTSRHTLRGVVHDVTSMTDPRSHIASSSTQPAGTGILAHPLRAEAPILSRLLTARHPWMHPSCLATDLLHPDDADALTNASRRILDDPLDEPTVTVRVRSHDDTWLLTDATVRRYPTTTLVSRRIRLIHLSATHHPQGPT